MEVCLSLWKMMERLLVTAFGCVNKNEQCNFAVHEGARGKTMSNKREMTRREFVKDVAVAGAGLAIVPRHVLGKGMTPPSDLLNIAGVGVGGMGRANLINLASQNIVALCDVDWGYAGKAFERLDADIERLRKRIEQPEPPPATGQNLTGETGFDREKAKVQLAGMIRLKNEHWPKAKRYTQGSGIYLGGRDWRSTRSACVDKPAAGILAAGSAPSGKAE